MTVTVFSASNYSGTDDNQGCHLVVYPSGGVEYTSHSVLPGADPLFLRSNSNRNQEQNAWTRGAKEECLQILRHAIFIKRDELLHEFQEADKEQTGIITLGDWVKALRVCVHSDLSWYMLSRYFVTREKSNRVAYFVFLERFRNELTRRWMNQWAAKVRPFIAERLALSADHHGGKLSYFDLCDIIRQDIPGLKERSIYYL